MARKNWLFIIFLTILASILLVANTEVLEGEPMHFVKTEGFIIGHGQYLKKPHSIYTKSGHILINGIQYFPLKSPQTGSTNISFDRQTQLDVRMCIDTRLAEQVRKWRAQHGKANTLDMAKIWLNLQFFVEQVSTSSCGINVKYKNGEKGAHFFGECHKTVQHKKLNRVTKERIVLRTIFKDRGVIIFGDSYRLAVPGCMAKAWLKRIDSNYTSTKALGKLLGNTLAAKDINENWKEPKVQNN